MQRKDVFPARDEHVLAPVDDGDEAVGIAPLDVAGANPSGLKARASRTTAKNAEKVFVYKDFEATGSLLRQVCTERGRK